MESLIDREYRLILFQFYIQDALEVAGGRKWIFPCPFCSPLARTDAKKRHRKAALLWNQCSTPGCSPVPVRGTVSARGARVSLV
jgi:hypothetical protein